MKNLISVIFLSTFVISCNRPASETTATPNSAAKPASSVTAAPANSTASPPSKGDRAAPDEAKAMLAKAVERYNSAGRETALAEFNSKKAPFDDRDLYVACIGSNDKLVANGGFPKLVGTSTDAWKDADGNLLGKAIRDAQAKGESSIKFNWYNPVTKALEHKEFFFQKVGDDICGVGAYSL